MKSLAGKEVWAAFISFDFELEHTLIGIYSSKKKAKEAAMSYQRAVDAQIELRKMTIL